MKVDLEHYTPIEFCVKAIRTCWDSHHKSNKEADRELLIRVGKKFKHESVLEHIVFNFHIKGISRACLQELARHRMASLSVESTRYTLKKLTKVEIFNKDYNVYNFGVANDFLVYVDDYSINTNSIEALYKLQQQLLKGLPIDQAKYCLPEAYKTNLAWTINLRSLLNFLELRTNPRALWEIQDLSQEIIKTLPKELEPFYKDYIRKDFK